MKTQSRMKWRLRRSYRRSHRLRIAGFRHRKILVDLVAAAVRAQLSDTSFAHKLFPAVEVKNEESQ